MEIEGETEKWRAGRGREGWGRKGWGREDTFDRKGRDTGSDSDDDRGRKR